MSDTPVQWTVTNPEGLQCAFQSRGPVKISTNIPGDIPLQLMPGDDPTLFGMRCRLEQAEARAATLVAELEQKRHTHESARRTIEALNTTQDLTLARVAEMATKCDAAEGENRRLRLLLDSVAGQLRAGMYGPVTLHGAGSISGPSR